MEGPNERFAAEPSAPGTGEPTGAPAAGQPTEAPTAAGSGIAPNLAGALAYLLGALTGILFLVIDRDRPFVRFHAMQSILLSVVGVALWIGLVVVSVVGGAIPIIGWLIGALLSIALSIGGLVLWIYLMVRAYGGDEWELPVLGAQARRLAAQA